MVPTGVPFALKAIIRVSNPNKFLRSLAVYPPENRGVIEKELLSSTSEEVCEVWNGHGVERRLLPLSESAPVEEWIYDGNLQPTSRALVRKWTTLLCLGLAYTAKVIDTSEHVTIWTPRKQNTLAIWIQQQNAALETDAYVIGKIIKKEFVWAHRPLSSCPSTSIACPVALAIIVGFLLQSIGLSIMHWPVQVLQLVAMTVMFLGRCYARKLDPPDFVVKLDRRISEDDLSDLAKSKRRQLLHHW
ncbi:hypothetical protein APSETT444_001156 [Aspergillus pseudonomiae]